MSSVFAVLTLTVCKNSAARVNERQPRFGESGIQKHTERTVPIGTTKTKSEGEQTPNEASTAGAKRIWMRFEQM